MDQIRNRREIIDRKSLNDRLEALAIELPWEAPGAQAPRARRAEGSAGRRPRGSASALRGRHLRRAHGAVELLSDRPADPHHLRSRRAACLPADQSDRGRAAGAGRGRRLRPRRAGAPFGHRSPVPAALQADAAWRAGGRIHALRPVGSRASRSARRRARSTSAIRPAPRPISPSAPRCSRRATSGATRL